MLHRKRQRNIVNPPPRAICRPLDRLVFPTPSSRAPRPSPRPLAAAGITGGGGGAHLTARPYTRSRTHTHTHAQTETRIFHCRFNSVTDMTDREFFCPLVRPPSSAPRSPFYPATVPSARPASPCPPALLPPPFLSVAVRRSLSRYPFDRRLKKAFTRYEPIRGKRPQSRSRSFSANARDTAAPYREVQGR